MLWKYIWVSQLFRGSQIQLFLTHPMGYATAAVAVTPTIFTFTTDRSCIRVGKHAASIQVHRESCNNLACDHSLLYGNQIRIKLSRRCFGFFIICSEADFTIYSYKVPNPLRQSHVCLCRWQQTKSAGHCFCLCWFVNFDISSRLHAISKLSVSFIFRRKSSITWD